MMEILLAIFSVVSALVLIVGLVAIGWYLVWKLFLSRFRFVRELLGGIQESVAQQSKTQEQAKTSRIRRSRRD